MFNPHARWDRPSLQPKQQRDQVIEVVAKFSASQIKPLYFTLNKRRFEIQRVNYFWKAHQGREKLYCFSVTSGANICQIYFNDTSLSWRLAKIE